MLNYRKIREVARNAHLSVSFDYATATSVSLPVTFRLIRKPIHYCEVKTQHEKRKGEVTKNE